MKQIHFSLLMLSYHTANISTSEKMPYFQMMSLCSSTIGIQTIDSHTIPDVLTIPLGITYIYIYSMQLHSCQVATGWIIGC